MRRLPPTIAAGIAAGITATLASCGSPTATRYHLTGQWTLHSYSITLTQAADRLTGIAACADVRVCPNATDGVTVTGTLAGSHLWLAFGPPVGTTSFSGEMMSASTVSGVLTIDGQTTPDTLRRIAGP